MSLVGERIGRLRIVEELGRGGMGEVYLGFDETLERNVAVKVIRKDHQLNPELKARFTREAKILSQLEHPNICRLYDLIEGEDHDLLVMERIKGKHLRRALKDGLSRTEKLKIARQIAEALSAAHARDIVHRDLKPDNVMITDDGLVKVLDFGLARAAIESPSQAAIADGEAMANGDPDTTIPSGGFETAIGVITGTPMFMSPEQAQGDRATAASDMYGLGLLMQWLFTEKTPYPEKLLPGEMIFRVITGKTRAIEGLDSELTALIGRLKSLNPEMRPTALDTADQLRWLLAKPKRRTKRLAMLAFVVVLVLGAAISTIGFVRASSEATKAKKTISLLQDLLSSVDPAEKGRDVKVLDLLEAFKPQVRELTDHPQIKATLLATFGSTYFSLGAYDEAYGFLKEAYDLRKSEFGDSDQRTRNVMTRMGFCLFYLGRHAEAERLQRRQLETLTELLGEDDPETATAMNNLAITLRGQGKREEAERLLQRTLTLRRRILGEDHPDTIMTANNLGNALQSIGKYDEAEKIHRDTLDAMRRVLGEDHPDTIGSMTNVATALAVQGKYAAAEPLFAEALDRQKRVLGEEHPSTSISMSNLAMIHRAQSKYADAERILRTASDVMTRKLGADHPDTLLAVNNLAMTLSAQGKNAEAEALFTKALEGRRRVLGEDHRDTLFTLNRLALTRAAMGRTAEAERLLRQTLEARQRVLGKDDRYTLSTLNNLAHILDERGKVEEALTLFRQVAEAFSRVLGSDHPQTVQAKHDLAKLLVNQNRNLPEAERLGREVLDANLERLGENHPDTQNSMKVLAAALEQSGQTQEAIELFTRAADGGDEEAQTALERLEESRH